MWARPQGSSRPTKRGVRDGDGRDRQRGRREAVSNGVPVEGEAALDTRATEGGERAIDPHGQRGVGGVAVRGVGGRLDTVTEPRPVVGALEAVQPTAIGDLDRPELGDRQLLVVIAVLEITDRRGATSPDGADARLPLPMMWKNELVAKSKSPTTAMRERGPSSARVPSGATGRLSAITMSVTGPRRSRPSTKATRSGLAWPQLLLDEFTTLLPRSPARDGSGSEALLRRNGASNGSSIRMR